MNAGIVSAGYALVDLVRDDRGERAATGGSPFNVALALGRLGASAAFLGVTSRDGHGARLRAALAEAGVDLSLAAVDARPTPLVRVERDGQGSPRFHFAMQGSAYEAPLPWPVAPPEGARHLHVGSTSAFDDGHGPGVLAALAAAPGLISTSFDPNLRPALLPGRDETRRRVGERVRLAGIVKASEEDLAWLEPATPPRDVVERWSRAGPRLAVLTRGARGALAFAHGQAIDVPGFAVPVVDTVGAGDTLMAALLAGLDEAGALGSGAPLPLHDRLRPIITRAVAASALVCTRAGCDPPTRAELDAFLAR